MKRILLICLLLISSPAKSEEGSIDECTELKDDVAALNCLQVIGDKKFDIMANKTDELLVALGIKDIEEMKPAITTWTQYVVGFCKALYGDSVRSGVCFIEEIESKIKSTDERLVKIEKENNPEKVEILDCKDPKLVEGINKVIASNYPMKLATGTFISVNNIENLLGDDLVGVCRANFKFTQHPAFEFTLGQRIEGDTHILMIKPLHRFW